MKNLIVTIFFLLLSTHVWADAYNALLGKYVKPGSLKGITVNLVDYGRWSKDELHQQALLELERALKKLDDEEREAQMAFWINAYNLLTIDLIIKEREYDSIRNLGNFILNPWKKHKWRLNGKYYTLHEIEHKILRPMGDPRIHFAINCASLSCPDLRIEKYRAARLDAQLEDQAQLFLKDNTKGISVEGDLAYISRLFDWFEEDFDSSGGVKSYISLVTSNDQLKIEYLPYNWKLNGYWE